MMQFQSEVLTEARYGMPVIIKDYLKMFWSRYFNENRIKTPKSFGQVIDFLLCNVDEHGVIIITTREIEEKTGLSYTTVRKSLSILEEHDFIEKKHRLILVEMP